MSLSGNFLCNFSPPFFLPLLCSSTPFVFLFVIISFLFPCLPLLGSTPLSITLSPSFPSLSLSLSLPLPPSPLIPSSSSLTLHTPFIPVCFLCLPPSIHPSLFSPSHPSCSLSFLPPSHKMGANVNRRVLAP